MRHGPEAGLCGCLSQLEQTCRNGDIFNGFNTNNSISHLRHDSDVGRIVYTCAILLMFAGIIILLMVRSIRRSKSTIEVETLLDAMRFREELDLQQRQKRRLQKAKNKVTAWLTKTNGKTWSSSPQIMVPGQRNNSLQSSGSFIPEIVISNSEENTFTRRQNSYTPSLSLIYDFDAASRRNSSISNVSSNSDLYNVSDLEDPDARALRQRSASRADTGDSAASAPASAAAAVSAGKRQGATNMHHSSTSSLAPGRHLHKQEVHVDVP